MYIGALTGADNRGIAIVGAAVDAPAREAALIDALLCPVAVHVAHPDGASPSTKSGTIANVHCIGIPQHPIYNHVYT